MEFKGVINVQSSGSITWGHDLKKFNRMSEFD